VNTVSVSVTWFKANLDTPFGSQQGSWGSEPSVTHTATKHNNVVAKKTGADLVAPENTHIVA